MAYKPARAPASPRGGRRVALHAPPPVAPRRAQRDAIIAQRDAEKAAKEAALAELAELRSQMAA